MGVGKRPVIIIELNDRTADPDSLTKELLAIGSENALTEDIKNVLYHPSFPVDIRHNAKINREKLSVWAAPYIPRSCGERSGEGDI